MSDASEPNGREPVLGGEQRAMWAVVELMGHQVIAGVVTEEERFGVMLMRVDVPAVDEHAAFTKFFGPSAIYAITPCDEESARAVIARIRPKPVSPYMLPAPGRATGNLYSVD